MKSSRRTDGRVLEALELAINCLLLGCYGRDADIRPALTSVRSESRKRFPMRRRFMPVRSGYPLQNEGERLVSRLAWRLPRCTSQAEPPALGIPADEMRTASYLDSLIFVQNAMKAAAELMESTSSRSMMARCDPRLAADASPSVYVPQQPAKFPLDLLLSRLNDLLGLIQRRRAERDDASPGPQDDYELEVRENLLNVVLYGRFNTNDLVRLSGSLPAKRGVLSVNAQQIDVGNLREFAVALILCQALKSAPTRGDSGFVPVPRILAQVQELLRPQPGLESEWSYAGPEDIHRVINALRRKLRDRHLNPFLIESGSRGQGYRLSTSPWNVQLPEA